MSTSDVPTAPELKKLLAARGVRPKRSLGQNFLIDPGLMHFIVDSAHLDRGHVVLEPGAGTGGLTGLLASLAGAVVAVETDAALHAIATDALAPFANTTVVHADVMAGDDDLAPSVRRALEDALASLPGGRFKVVANLPYQIATTLITTLLGAAPCPDEMILTVQREVADRIAAPPGCKEYGYLSVIVQSVARVRRLRRISPKAFWPQPKIESTVLRITPDPELRRCAGDLRNLRRLASALFQHRRKQAARGLILARLTPDLDAAGHALRQTGAPQAARPEALTIRQFITLARIIFEDNPPPDDPEHPEQ